MQSSALYQQKLLYTQGFVVAAVADRPLCGAALLQGKQRLSLKEWYAALGTMRSGPGTLPQLAAGRQEFSSPSTFQMDFLASPPAALASLEDKWLLIWPQRKGMPALAFLPPTNSK